MKILYIHGYNGSPAGQKVERIQQAYPKAEVIALQHNSVPQHVFELQINLKKWSNVRKAGKGSTLLHENMNGIKTCDRVFHKTQERHCVRNSSRWTVETTDNEIGAIVDELFEQRNLRRKESAICTLNSVRSNMASWASSGIFLATCVEIPLLTVGLMRVTTIHCPTAMLIVIFLPCLKFSITWHA